MNSHNCSAERSGNVLEIKINKAMLSLSLLMKMNFDYNSRKLNVALLSVRPTPIFILNEI